MRTRIALTGLALGTVLLGGGIAAPAAQASPAAEAQVSPTRAWEASTDAAPSPAGALGWVHVAYFDWSWTCEAARTDLELRGFIATCTQRGAFTWELRRLI
ncbi:hypothetical protein [Streptomyces sp. NBC_00826]|uniref:hypothetical protein n=1 Tax=Streptomyces sp. NBC_00826 TaxID=2975845 RepID=UPI002F90A325|nr:hypothetical protein OG832_45670 [Streptomyces sp. NBC_00826]